MEASTNTTSSRARGTASRVTAKLFATVSGLFGLALMLGGGAAIAGHFERDDGGVNSDRQKLESTAYAITSDDIDLGVGELDWAPTGFSARSGCRSRATAPCSWASAATRTWTGTSATSSTTS